MSVALNCDPYTFRCVMCPDKVLEMPEKVVVLSSVQFLFVFPFFFPCSDAPLPPHSAATFSQSTLLFVLPLPFLNPHFCLFFATLCSELNSPCSNALLFPHSVATTLSSSTLLLFFCNSLLRPGACCLQKVAGPTLCLVYRLPCLVRTMTSQFSALTACKHCRIYDFF